MSFWPTLHACSRYGGSIGHEDRRGTRWRFHDLNPVSRGNPSESVDTLVAVKPTRQTKVIYRTCLRGRLRKDSQVFAVSNWLELAPQFFSALLVWEKLVGSRIHPPVTFNMSCDTSRTRVRELKKYDRPISVEVEAAHGLNPRESPDLT